LKEKKLKASQLNDLFCFIDDFVRKRIQSLLWFLSILYTYYLSGSSRWR